VCLLRKPFSPSLPFSLSLALAVFFTGETGERIMALTALQPRSQDDIIRYINREQRARGRRERTRERRAQQFYLTLSPSLSSFFFTF
jgi:hypothetical protein